MTAYASPPVSVSLAEMPSTPGARWLQPSAWPDAAGHLFRPRPFDPSTSPPVVSLYEDVRRMMIQDEHLWSREVPLTAVPPEVRHCAFDASWMTDGDTHNALRRSLRRINRGSTADAREFTRVLTSELMASLMSEPPPWDLASVIYEVSMRTIIEHTLAAPPLLPHSRRLRELVREVDTARGFFGIQRQPEMEELLLDLDERRDALPDGLARDLVDLHRRGGLTRHQLAGQLAMVVVSYETQATAVASLIGMLLEHGYWDYALEVAEQPELMRRLIAEGDRRGIVFPVNLMTPVVPVAFGDQIAPAGQPVLMSYAAANVDPTRFGADAVRFDPRPKRPPHVAFGEGAHRCQGAAGADQFTRDVLTALLHVLPASVRLDRGQVLRETAGVVWAIARLPVVPG